jgi:hypothetical protein
MDEVTASSAGEWLPSEVIASTHALDVQYVSGSWREGTGNIQTQSLFNFIHLGFR